jgi:hypothetical protein
LKTKQNIDQQRAFFTCSERKQLSESWNSNAHTNWLLLLWPNFSFWAKYIYLTECILLRIRWSNWKFEKLQHILAIHKMKWDESMNEWMNRHINCLFNEDSSTATHTQIYIYDVVGSRAIKKKLYSVLCAYKWEYFVILWNYWHLFYLSSSSCLRLLVCADTNPNLHKYIQLLYAGESLQVVILIKYYDLKSIITICTISF